MTVTHFEIRETSKFYNDKCWGSSGPYKRIDGIVHFSVDPSNPANNGIIDLDKAELNEEKRVPFSSDFTLVTPINQDPVRLLVDVTNRGRKKAFQDFNMSNINGTLGHDIDPGDGFLFKSGFGILSLGWQFDVYRKNGLLGMKAPLVLENGKPVIGSNSVEIRPTVEMKEFLLADRTHIPYPSASLSKEGAYLMVRDWEDGPDTLIPPSEWAFAKNDSKHSIPSKNHIFLNSGFQPGKIYNFVYKATGAVVTGTTLLSVRDTGSWIRNSSKTPFFDKPPRYLYAYGVSQTGRLLRHFIYAGMNIDENGEKVYDGILPHVAGGRRGNFNHRFGQPSQQSAAGFGHLFPFADQNLKDPFSSKEEGLQDTQKIRGQIPKIIYTNTSAEYWRGDGSLAHMDPSGCCDQPLPNNARTYMFSGTQHGAGSIELLKSPPSEKIVEAYKSNIVDYRPLLRGALLNLVAWVEKGIEPPASCTPRLDDETAISRRSAIELMPDIPGQHLPNPDRLWRIREMDLGENTDIGITKYPIIEGRTYPCFVSTLDKDGNEVSGIRMPDISVPLATHTGWNLRNPETGSPEQLLSMIGLSSAFAISRASRETTNDPRLSIEERYTSREDYLQKVRVEAQKLADESYILHHDIDVIVKNCSNRYEYLVSKLR